MHGANDKATGGCLRFMPDFTVDIGGLDALGKNLDRTVDNIDQAIVRMEDIGPGFNRAGRP